jgi:hypothetical protein
VPVLAGVWLRYDACPSVQDWTIEPGRRVGTIVATSSAAELRREFGAHALMIDADLASGTALIPWGDPSISITEDNDEHIETRVERQRLNPRASAILLRGRQVEIPPDAAAYKARGLKPQKPIALPDVLRYLFATHRDDMFSTDAERAKLLPKMTKLLTLDRWRHYTRPRRAERNRGDADARRRAGHRRHLEVRANREAEYLVRVERAAADCELCGTR